MVVNVSVVDGGSAVSDWIAFFLVVGWDGVFVGSLLSWLSTRSTEVQARKRN